VTLLECEPLTGHEVLSVLAAACPLSHPDAGLALNVWSFPSLFPVAVAN
jgi:hypothetical protein